MYSSGGNEHEKILIVDDEPTILMTLSHLLSNRDTTVITAAGWKRLRRPFPVHL